MAIRFKVARYDHDMVGGGQEDREWENNCVWRLKKVRRRRLWKTTCESNGDGQGQTKMSN